MGKAVEYMLCDAMKAADSSLRIRCAWRCIALANQCYSAHIPISESIDDCEAYSHMTDSIIMEIERSRDPGQRARCRRHGDPFVASHWFPLSTALHDAQTILRRLRCRDLYKIVGDRLLSTEQAVHASKAATPEHIASCADASLPLHADDIIVHQLKINYAMKDKNPVDSVSFYNGNDDLPFHLPKSKVSLMIPDIFEEKCDLKQTRSCI